MATRKAATHKPAEKPAAKVVDSRGKTRVYADVPRSVAKAFKILALQREVDAKDLLAEIMAKACEGVQTE